MSTLVVIAKAPVAGEVKTRLCPPCTPQQAAAIAEAALADTLAVVRATPARRHVCVLHGAPGPWLPEGVEVIAQRGDGLAERLAGAFEDVGGPALLVGMDTPQLSSSMLLSALERLRGHDAVLGPARDGGYWAIGLQRADRELFTGVPMSAPDTGARQRERLLARGLSVGELPALRDVDTIADARRVATLVPHGRFAAAVNTMSRQLV